jgi:hypothetical protein
MMTGSRRIGKHQRLKKAARMKRRRKRVLGKGRKRKE